MEASTTKMKSYQPQPLSELLPGLSGLLSKDGTQTFTARKQPRPTMAQTSTTVKAVKPLTLAELRDDILALKTMTRSHRAQPVSSIRKKGWNSSVKVEFKKISHTNEGQQKNNPVRKVLNFQTKPKPVAVPRMTMHGTASETPKFPKPEFRPKKSMYVAAKNNVRISGIFNIPPTPVETKPIRSRMTIANKENNPHKPNINLITPTPKSHKKVHPTPVIDNPIFNSSWKSGSDTSFLQREKEIHELEEKVNAVMEEPTLENIAEISPPVSTPFKEYRSVQEYFNNSSYIDSSAVYNDNTIMCFDKPSVCKDADKKEESVIVTLCDLFNKATVTKVEKATTELDNLLEVEKQTQNNINMIENGIQMLNNIKESQMKSLQHVRKLIQEKKGDGKNSDNDKTLVDLTEETEKMDEDKTLSPEKSPVISKPCSVIRKSPSYKIPRKSIGLRKKIICKSMPNISNGMQTPVKDINGKALNMYMKMKETMNFLNTPMVNRETKIPDTPALTSHNLQKQLDKLYNRS